MDPTRVRGATGATGPRGATGAMSPIGYTGVMGPTGPRGATGAMDPIGYTGVMGPTGHRGVTGATGAMGPIGYTGAIGPYGTVGYAEYIHTIQAPNNSIPPGTAFTIDTEIFNNVPGYISASPGAGGTVFTLQEGAYFINYETSLESAGSIAIYTGPNASSLAIDTNTISGSSTATTWIHGTAIEYVAPTGSLALAISSVVGTASVATSGTASTYIIRILFIKIA